MNAWSVNWLPSLGAPLIPALLSISGYFFVEWGRTQPSGWVFFIGERTV